jgi:Spy/CpxP family protein refolding chaperone
MKQIILITLFLFSLTSASAEEQQKFSPEKFQADLEQFITQEASLTADEAAKFFPLYREMQSKQRVIYKQMKELGKNKPADEKACRKAVEKRDELELEQKRICQSYHQKFFNVLSASKVYDVIKAENRFHRKAIRHWEQHKKK